MDLGPPISHEALEKGVAVLRLDAAACSRLPRPSANPAVVSDDPADSSSALSEKLRRAWDRVSGNY